MRTVKPRWVARARKAASAASPRRLRVGSAEAWRVIEVEGGWGCSELWVAFCITKKAQLVAAPEVAPLLNFVVEMPRKHERRRLEGLRRCFNSTYPLYHFGGGKWDMVGTFISCYESMT